MDSLDPTLLQLVHLGMTKNKVRKKGPLGDSEERATHGERA